jgi:hypothetical protein
MQNTTLLDNEGCRLFGLYEASSAKEFTAARQLLYPSHRLLYPEYMKRLGDLQATRKECNDKRLAVEAHRTKMRDLDCIG